jgi:hypothetical protein
MTRHPDPPPDEAEPPARTVPTELDPVTGRPRALVEPVDLEAAHQWDRRLWHA